MQQAILQPRGRLDGAAAAAFERDLLASVESEPAWLLLDFAELDYIASAGLRVVLLATKRLRGSNRRLVLCGLRPQVAEIFAISGLSEILSIYPDRTTAMAAML
jgi:anti-anti-sigma factor